MTEPTAVYYGIVELIPNILCDGYVLDDGTAVLSERGTADLLGMNQKTRQSMATNWPPKSLQIFADHSDSMTVNFVEVVATNSPYRHRKTMVYATSSIQALILRL